MQWETLDTIKSLRNKLKNKFKETDNRRKSSEMHELIQNKEND